MLTAAEAAKLVNKSARAIRGWISDGDLPASGLPGHRLIRRQDLVRTLLMKGYEEEARNVAAVDAVAVVREAIEAPHHDTAVAALAAELAHQRDRAERLQAELTMHQIMLALMLSQPVESPPPQLPPLAPPQDAPPAGTDEPAPAPAGHPEGRSWWQRLFEPR